jgi:hypothetical protein
VRRDISPRECPREGFEHSRENGKPLESNTAAQDEGTGHKAPNRQEVWGVKISELVDVPDWLSCFAGAREQIQF